MCVQLYSIVSNGWSLLLVVHLYMNHLGNHAGHVHMQAPGPAVKIGHLMESLTNGSSSLMCPAVMTVSSCNELRPTTNPTLLSYLSSLTVS